MTDISRQRIVLSDEEFKATVLTNGRILQEFPFLQTAKQLKDSLGTCAPCQRGAKGKALTAEIHRAQQHFAAMSDQDRAKLKELLGAGSVRLFYRATKNDMAVVERIDF